MARSYFSLALAALCSCVVALATFPARALDFAVDLFSRFPVLVDARAIRDLFRTGPALALAGPADATIDPALAIEQKHEAGLARLGSVRHR